MHCELILPLLAGWMMDLALGDPVWLPHPVVAFGRLIAWGEHRLNRGRHRMAKGAVISVVLDGAVFAVAWALLHLLATFAVLQMALSAVVIFYCLAGTTLIREVRQVFLALDRSLDEGRRQVARIVGRDTAELSAQEVRTAALETLAENLSDGVVAPLFWLAVGGPAAMLTYKMINTQDSMVGYRTERYRDFGCWAARIDDVANYVPARLTAVLMLALNLPLRGGRFAFLRRNAGNHASPNSGWPEAALAAVLDCRFGGPHYYFGQLFPKPYIGDNPRDLTTADMRLALRLSRRVEAVAVVLSLLLQFL